MLKYITQIKDLNEIMGVLYRVLDIRITFFDMQGYEQDSFDIKEMTPFCRRFRKNKTHNQKCIDCDLQHLKFAKQTRTTHIYHCHKGLLEGIIPLYDRHNIYIGSVVFGQLRDCEHNFQATNDKEEKLYSQIKALTLREVEDIGLLLKLVSEYIIENEIIKYKNKPWAELIEDHIKNNLDKHITLKELSILSQRSPSFLSHNFKQEFGLAPRQYILQEKMIKAKDMISNGESVRNTALDLGFYDEFHFSKRFKTYWGKSPKYFK